MMDDLDEDRFLATAFLKTGKLMAIELLSKPHV